MSDGGAAPRSRLLDDIALPDSVDEAAQVTFERRVARRSLLIGGLVAVVAPVGVAAFVGGHTKRAAAREFVLADLADDSLTVTLAARPGRPALVNFWASWCGPCRGEMPVLQSGFARFGDRVQFLGVDHQDSRAAAQAFVAAAGVQYRSGFDPDGGVAASYAIRGLPTTVLITGDGRIAATVTGALTTERLERLLGDLLGIR